VKIQTFILRSRVSHASLWQVFPKSGVVYPYHPLAGAAGGGERWPQPGSLRCDVMRAIATADYSSTAFRRGCAVRGQLLRPRYTRAFLRLVSPSVHLPGPGVLFRRCAKLGRTALLAHRMNQTRNVLSRLVCNPTVKPAFAPHRERSCQRRAGWRCAG